MPLEIAADLVKLSLFDTVLYVDDSGSMAFEENGERIDDLKLILSRVAYATSLFDHDGIQVRFMNNRIEGNNITTEAQALQLVQQVRFSGLTPLGTSLWSKIIQPLLLGPARANALQKPLLIIGITDGTPAGENKDEVFSVISRTDAELRRTRYGPDAVSYRESLFFQTPSYADRPRSIFSGIPSALPARTAQTWLKTARSFSRK